MRKPLIIVLGILMLFGCSKTDRKTTAFSISSGMLERIEILDSKYIAPRNIDVWLPDGYQNDEKYSVLYMHDGQMLYDSTATWNKQEWGVDEVMSELIEANKIRKTIVVSIWNTENRHSEYFPQKPFEMLTKTYQDSLLYQSTRNKEIALFSENIQSDNYLKFLVKELKPFIDENYSTKSNVENTFIAGSSMGGLISMYAICEYPEIFGGAACLSTHWTGIFSDENNPIPEKFIIYLKENLPEPSTHKFYFDYGTETLDSLYEPFQIQADSIMVLRGFGDNNWITLKFQGDDHSEKSWRNRLHIPMTFLLVEKNMNSK